MKLIKEDVRAPKITLSPADFETHKNGVPDISHLANKVRQRTGDQITPDIRVRKIQ